MTEAWEDEGGAVEPEPGVRYNEVLTFTDRSLFNSKANLEQVCFLRICAETGMDEEDHVMFTLTIHDMVVRNKVDVTVSYTLEIFE